MLVFWIVVFLLLSAFFSGTEIAFFTANKLGVEVRKNRGSSSGKILSDFYDKIKDFENGKRDELFWDGQAFQHKITKEKVVFINTIFGVCEEYPIWHCKFKEYVKTLKSWKEFLELPIKIQTKIELEV